MSQEEHNLEHFRSKKNEVYRDAEKEPGKVIKKFSAAERFDREKEMWDTLQDTELPLPKRIFVDENKKEISYRYIPGAPVVDLLERLPLPSADLLVEKICEWMVEFYRVISEKKGEIWILGDAHLRNFLYETENDTLYGIDLEECRPGRPETDIGRLYVFILNYDPAFTPRKKRLATHFHETISNLMELDQSFFQSEVCRETAELRARRRANMESVG